MEVIEPKEKQTATLTAGCSHAHRPNRHRLSHGLKANNVQT